jgi:transposase
MNHPSTLVLTTGQKTMLKTLIKTTDSKQEYCRLLAILQKGEGRTYLDIARQHGVSSRSVQRWIAAYLKKGIDGLRNKKSG